MRTSIVVCLVIGLILVALAVSLGISWLAYWLALKAGAPKYVAVITGIAVFSILGLGSNFKSK